MLRVWGKIFSTVKMVRDAECADERTDLPFDVRLEDCLEEIVKELDLPKPIWFPVNREELNNFRKTQFRQDNFVEAFPYMYFELEILETDDDEK